MKKVLLLLPVILIVFLSGCAQDQAALKILEDAETKSNALSSFDLAYLMTIDTSAGEKSIAFTGTMDMKKEGDKIKMDMEMGMPSVSDQSIKMTYYLGENSYICMITNETNCFESPIDMTEVSGMQSIQVDELKKMVDSGVLTLRHSGVKTIAGKACDEIIFVYDISKLTEEYLSEVLGLFGSSGDMATQMGGVEAIKSIDVKTCMGKESGLPLNMEMDMGMEIQAQSADISMKMTATKAEANKDIPDTEFEIPADANVVTGLEALGVG